MAEGGGEILEGFLCPVCKTDLETEVQLQIHFQEHTEDQDVLKFLKGNGVFNFILMYCCAFVGMETNLEVPYKMEIS
jgi:hypothetical protein